MSKTPPSSIQALCATSSTEPPPAWAASRGRPPATMLLTMSETTANAAALGRIDVRGPATGEP